MRVFETRTATGREEGAYETRTTTATRTSFALFVSRRNYFMSFRVKKSVVTIEEFKLV